MGRFVYREQDYAFGQIMLTLRTNIGLTQGSLADYLGVSRRTVGAWEAGNKYPNPHHLKQLIALAIQQHAFPAGEEADAIRSLWRASHQKLLIDERWLADLLAFAPDADDSRNPASARQRDGRRIDWGGALAIRNFYGREWEQAQLIDWVLQERCRVVGILGLGGIGKSALSVSLMRQLSEQFDVVIWRSLRDTPTCGALLADCLRVLAPQLHELATADFEQSQSLFLQFLREHRTLIVLDNLEALLEEQDAAGGLRAGYEDYGALLRRISETEHQSCLLFTSREKPISLIALEGDPALIRLLRLARLESKPCEQLLAEKGVIGSDAEKAKLIDLYAGNPLALKIVAQTIVDLFDGEIAPFLDQGEIIFGSIRQLLREQFARLSSLEQSLLLWLAILRAPASINELSAAMVAPASRAHLLDAIQSLYRRSLIERGQQPGSFTLQSVVLEYLTARLVEEASDELQRGEFSRLIDYGFEVAQSSEDVRQTQQRLLLRPILDYLHSAYLDAAEVESMLIGYLDPLRRLPDTEQGYAPANLLVLLKLLQGHLCRLDLSRLCLWNIALQGVEMQDSVLADASIRDCTFTETFDAVTHLSISGNGDYWAAVSRSFEVRIWEARGRSLVHLYNKTSGLIDNAALSPDGRTLAGSCVEGTLKLWDVSSGVLIWASERNYSAGTAFRLLFSPDGSVIATADLDLKVRLWDTSSGALLDVLAQPEQTPSIAWRSDGTMLASGDATGTLHLWAIHQGVPATIERTIAAHDQVVTGLDFSPDGARLVSASWDGTVKLWNTATGALEETLTGHQGRVQRVAWSRDGRLIASSGRDQTLRLWDVEQQRYRATLRGHGAMARALIFTPDSLSLVSGSDDGTIRVWDTTTGACSRIIHGYTAMLYNLGWSPDCQSLVVSGSDATLTLYRLDESLPPLTMSGHTSTVNSMAWNPANHLIASDALSENFVRLWDGSTGALLDSLTYPADPSNAFRALVWSPDGRILAAGTGTHGILLIDTETRSVYPLVEDSTVHIDFLAWSPDGSMLAAVSAGSRVFIWDARSGALLHSLPNLKPYCIAWSTDSARLVMGTGVEGETELNVWHIASGQLRVLGERHPGAVWDIAWIADDIVVSGAVDGCLRWWDVQTNARLRQVQAHQGNVCALKLSPDGTMLASCGDDGLIAIHDPRSGDLLKTLRRDRPYERMDIRGIRGISDAQKATLIALGAIDDHEPGL